MTDLAHKDGGLVLKSGGLGTSCSCCQSGLCKRWADAAYDPTGLFSETECTVTDTVTSGTFVVYTFAYFFDECGLDVPDCPLLVGFDFAFTNEGKELQFGCIAAGGTLVSSRCIPACGPSGSQDCSPLCNSSDGVLVVLQCDGQVTDLDYTVTFTVRGRL